MGAVLGIGLGVVGLVVGILIYPTANTILQGFITEQMPSLGFSDTLSAIVSSLPIIIFVLFILVSVVYIWSQK